MIFCVLCFKKKTISWCSLILICHSISVESRFCNRQQPALLSNKKYLFFNTKSIRICINSDWISSLKSFKVIHAEMMRFFSIHSEYDPKINSILIIGKQLHLTRNDSLAVIKTVSTLRISHGTQSANNNFYLRQVYFNFQ